MTVILFLLVSLIAVGIPVDSKASSAQPGASYENVPPSIDPSRKYLFYLHGRIVSFKGVKL